MCARCGGNRRRLKFWRCDISAKVSTRRSAGASVRSALGASRVMRAPRGRRGFRGRRLGGFRDYVGIGRWHVRRDGWKRRGCWGMYDRRWCLRAIRQEVGVERDKAEREHRPDHQEVFQDQHHSPASHAARGVCGVHLQPYADTAMAPIFLGPRTRHGRPFLARARRSALDPTSKMKTRLGFLPAGLHRSRPRSRRYIRGRKLGRERDSI
jgi:hypothetical protein